MLGELFVPHVSSQVAFSHSGEQLAISGLSMEIEGEGYPISIFSLNDQNSAPTFSLGTADDSFVTGIAEDFACGTSHSGSPGELKFDGFIVDRSGIHYVDLANRHSTLNSVNSNGFAVGASWADGLEPDKTEAIIVSHESTESLSDLATGTFVNAVHISEDETIIATQNLGDRYGVSILRNTTLDQNSDRIITFSDYGLYFLNFGEGAVKADSDRDGEIDSRDVLVFERKFFKAVDATPSADWNDVLPLVAAASSSLGYESVPATIWNAANEDFAFMGISAFKVFSDAISNETPQANSDTRDAEDESDPDTNEDRGTSPVRKSTPIGRGFENRENKYLSSKFQQ